MKRTKRHAPGSVVFDRRRGTWQFYYYVSGKRRSRVIGTRQEFPTKAAAWKEVERKPPVREPESPKGDTMAALIERYQNERMLVRKSTSRVYRSFLRSHIIPKWGSMDITDVQPRDVELWLRSLDKAPKTRKHLRNLMHVLFEFAMWAKLLPIQRNPMDLVVVKGGTKRVRKPRSLAVEEFHALLAQLREPFATIALVCVCLGLRISEALALRWCDLDWMGSTVSIRRSIVERNVDEPKTAESYATMSASPELLGRLHLLRQTVEFSAEEDWLFASPVKIGRLPYSYSGVWRELKRAAIAAGIGPLGTHAFRHTYRSWLDQVGTQLAVQQKAMRHTDISMTMRYGDVVDDRIGQALEKVSGLAFANSTQTARGEA